MTRSRRAGQGPKSPAAGPFVHRPLYARVLRLRHLAPNGFLCFAYLEGAIALGILLALAELVSWWGILVLPATVAVMVKLNDAVAGAVSRPVVQGSRRVSSASADWASSVPGTGRDRATNVPPARGAPGSLSSSPGDYSRETDAADPEGSADSTGLGSAGRRGDSAGPRVAGSGVAGSGVAGPGVVLGVAGPGGAGGAESEAGSYGVTGSERVHGSESAVDSYAVAGSESLGVLNSAARYYGAGGRVGVDGLALRPAASPSLSDDPKWSPEETGSGRSSNRPRTPEARRPEPRQQDPRRAEGRRQEAGQREARQQEAGGWVAAAPAPANAGNPVNGPRTAGQWADHLDSRQQRTRQAATRRYE
jgi:hypothetical protein